MTEPTLTPFQIEAEGAVLALLAHGGRRIDQREILHGVVPVLSRDPVTIVRLIAGDATCWIDDDDLDFKIGGRGVHLERADYSSATDFLTDFLRKFREALLSSTS